MPRSPLTLALGLAIVAAFFLVLLWPDQAAQEWGLQAGMSLPVVLGLFAWRAVKDAPPLDDQAFHRTLPPGDGHAFRRVLASHGWVLLGIALAVVVYCVNFNFGWQVMSYGVLALTLPVWGLMAAHGIAVSLATSRQLGKSWGLIAVYVSPLISASLIYNFRDGFGPEKNAEDQYLNSYRIIVLVAALLYPLVWWLVAVRRRIVTALCLATTISGMIPVFLIYGGLFTASEESAQDARELSRISVIRKMIAPGEDKWIPIDDIISVNGLREGEVMQAWGLVGGAFFGFHEVPDDLGLREYGVTRTLRLATTLGNGRVIWGEAAVWKLLQKQIPGLETFDYWCGGMDVPSHVSILRPGESALVRQNRWPSRFKPKLFEQKVTEDDLNTVPWKSFGASVFRFEKVGVVDAAGGGNFRLSQGGVLSVYPLGGKNGDLFIMLEQFNASLQDAEGPWFKVPPEEELWRRVPWVIAVDRSGKHALALSGIRSEGSEKVILGEVRNWGLRVWDAKGTEQLARMEMLRGCSLHVFLPRVEGRFQQELPPPR